jgi:hypothetical protein
VHRSWQLNASHYTAAPPEPPSPSRQVLKLIEWLRTFGVRLVNQTTRELAAAMLPKLVRAIVECVRDCEEPLWRHVSQLPLAGVVQLALDLRYLQEGAAALGHSGSLLSRAVEALVQRALLEHCASHGIKNPSTVFPSFDWFRDALAPHLPTGVATTAWGRGSGVFDKSLLPQ